MYKKNSIILAYTILVGSVFYVSCVNPSENGPQLKAPHVLSLSWSNLVLEPAFSSSVNNYQIQVPSGETTSSFTFQGEGGTQLVSGGHDLVLNTSQPPGEIFRKVVFKGDNGQLLTYSFQLVYPDLPPNSSTLTSLQFDTGTLVPDFSPNVTAYTLRVSAYTTGIITALAAAPSGADLTYTITRAVSTTGIWTFLVHTIEHGSTTYSVEVVQDASEPIVNPNLPSVRPFLSLQDFDGALLNPRFNAFRSWVDLSVNSYPNVRSGFEVIHPLILWYIASLPGSGINPQPYHDLTLQMLKEQVTQARTAMRNRQRPQVAGDSFLEAGPMISAIAYGYDRFYNELTPTERQQWKSYGDQVLFNIWNPEQAFWTDPDDNQNYSAEWSGWGTNQPGNNYHFSFIKATLTWALATQNSQLIEFLVQDKFPTLIEYFDRFPGGGSREGTGYGVAQTRLFDIYLLWKANTGQNLAEFSSHAKASLLYWVHATAPTLNIYAPIGDLSRDSYPTVFDYHIILMHQLTTLFPNSPEAAQGRWWLNHVTTQYPLQLYNYIPLLTNNSGMQTVPQSSAYHSPGSGHFFARSDWTSNSPWLVYVAGRLDESHAHQDQGSFQLYMNENTGETEDNWLTSTANIWGLGGLSAPVNYHNGLRFESASGTVSQLTRDDPTLNSTMNWRKEGEKILIDSNLTGAYNPYGITVSSLVKNWQRKLEFERNQLRVRDNFEVAPGVSAIFQIQVKDQPTALGDGSIQAGNLTVVPFNAVRLVIRKLQLEEGVFYSNDGTNYITPPNGWVIELHDGPRNGNLGSFEVLLQY